LKIGQIVSEVMANSLVSCFFDSRCISLITSLVNEDDYSISVR